MSQDDTQPLKIEIEDPAGLSQETACDVAAPSAEQRIAELEQQLAARQEDVLRAVADLQNFRRRAAEERLQQLQFATEQVLSDLLPVLDNFARATECQVDSDAGQSLHRGVCMIRDQLYQVMTSHGLARLEVTGQPFDPAWHEAVERVETETVAEGTIVAEVLPGYSLSGRLLRPARVKVAVPPRAVD